MHHETRNGALLDIMSDRFCSAAFYFGLAWLHPEFTVPVVLYLAEFMVIDFFLSIAFLAWNAWPATAFHRATAFRGTSDLSAVFQGVEILA